MRHERWQAWLAGLLFGFGAAAAIAEDIETVEKRLVEAFRKHKSVTAKVAMKTHVEVASLVMDATGEGTLEIARHGEQTFVRMEVKTTVVQKTGEQESKIEQQMLTIVDGQAAYVLTEMMGQKSAVKSKIDPQMTGDPQAVFARLRKENDLKLLLEETVDGRKIHAIEVTPKEKNPGGPAKQVYYFDQDSGFMVKMVSFDAGDRPVSTMTYGDLKFDTPIDPKRFRFEVPPGVEIIERP